ncbi:unnamed protein product [Paramecium primaurelia]|uniref:Transmembrane protein n=1 Tax=Paramecium primaurelia TaxID=5886 RepID=A0A8S1MZZ4_PARPR|nr:unnamed protein product [Paramecium primaurelia]
MINCIFNQCIIFIYTKENVNQILLTQIDRQEQQVIYYFIRKQDLKSCNGVILVVNYFYLPQIELVIAEQIKQEINLEFMFISNRIQKHDYWVFLIFGSILNNNLVYSLRLPIFLFMSKLIFQFIVEYPKQRCKIILIQYTIKMKIINFCHYFIILLLKCFQLQFIRNKQNIQRIKLEQNLMIQIHLIKFFQEQILLQAYQNLLNHQIQIFQELWNN